jgi:hypothetical protein
MNKDEVTLPALKDGWELRYDDDLGPEDPTSMPTWDLYDTLSGRPEYYGSAFQDSFECVGYIGGQTDSWQEALDKLVDHFEARA